MARKKFNEKELQIHRMFFDARSRAREKNLPFSITKEHLKSIATNECPIFKTPFEWGHSKLGRGKQKLNGPQLDRIVPELGYVEGNVVACCRSINMKKGDLTIKDIQNLFNGLKKKKLI